MGRDPPDRDPLDRESPGQRPPPGQAVEERTVGMLLEWILVLYFIKSASI